MSLANKLGTQGRALLANSSFSDGNEHNESVRLPNKLDFLLSDLIDPNSTTKADQFLSYLAYYYPTLKHEVNVELLTVHFLRSPSIFHLDMPYQQLYRIIECFNYITDKKMNISVPTLPFYKFYNGILQGVLKYVASDPINHHWKIIPMLSGILLSIERRSNEACYMEHFKFIAKVDHHLNTILQDCLLRFNYGYMSHSWRLLYITVLSLSHSSFKDDQLIKISNKFPNLPLIVLDNLLNSEFGLNKGNAITLSPNNSSNYPPILKNMSSFAILYGRLVDISNVENNLDPIDFSLNKIQFFSNDLFNIYCTLEQQNQHSPAESSIVNETLLKNCLFAIIIIEESIVRNTLYKRLDNDTILLQNISRKLMISLFNMNFIIEKIGTGGFQSFNFVYLSTIDFLLFTNNSETSEILAQIFTSSIDFTNLSSSFCHRCKLLYFLNLFENIIHLCSDDIKLKLIIPIVEDIINKNCLLINDKEKLKPILESAHSIMLKYFSILEITPRPKNFNFRVNFEKIQPSLMDYTSKILRTQYPQFLSSNQYLSIIEKLSRLVFPNSVIHSVNHEIYTNFMKLIYQDIKTIPSTTMNVDNSTKFLTCHAVKISSLIRCTPLLPLAEYIHWLDTILFNLILKNNLLDSTDRNLLLDNLFETILVVNKFDSEKGLIGIDWFYSNVNNEPKL